MSQLTEKMNAAIAALKAQQTGLTADQVHAIVDPQIAELKSGIEAIGASEKDDAAKVADLLETVGNFVDAFAPATPAQPAETPAAPQPEPAATEQPAPEAATSEPTPEPAPEAA